MKWKDPESDDLVFESTGKELPFYSRIVGISPESVGILDEPVEGYVYRSHNVGDFFEGYDGTHSISTLTPEERRELADYMIGLWQKFGEGDGSLGRETEMTAEEVAGLTIEELWFAGDGKLVPVQKAMEVMARAAVDTWDHATEIIDDLTERHETLLTYAHEIAAANAALQQVVDADSERLLEARETRLILEKQVDNLASKLVDTVKELQKRRKEIDRLTEELESRHPTSAPFPSANPVKPAARGAKRT